MIFFSREVVMNDIERFARAINNDYNAKSCEVYVEQKGESLWLGYAIDKKFQIKMPYVFNESGEISQTTKVWTISKDGKIINNECRTLGEAFEIIGLKKINENQ
ncbi:DUF5634 family protein [Paenibacillus xylaniclasticus]|uniref:DUF5634 family protein n=1 Tax=Paenibacillus xylaniclasticus TaxID=588083 RepID=UPI000FDB2C29|nr:MULTISPECIES: DUF5634 family protein [Paenibacillus]GFN32393.1 hypothetical protein PCURB6_26530 [Paenibacillus curdlanolyticus]